MGILRHLQQWRETGDGVLRGSTVRATGGVILVPEDLTARNGSEPGEISMHDGTGTPAEGLYRWNGTDWIAVEESGTI